MKLAFNLKSQEASFEADVERIVEKSIESKENYPAKKTRYQIKQEEKRKNAELKHKQETQKIYVLIGIAIIPIIIAIVCSLLGF